MLSRVFVVPGSGERDDDQQREEPARSRLLRRAFDWHFAHRSPVSGERGTLQRGRTLRRGQHRDDRIGIELEKARVIARESPHERASGQTLEVIVFERLHLTRRKLQLLRDDVDREAGCFARHPQARPCGIGRHPARRRPAFASVDLHVLFAGFA